MQPKIQKIAIPGLMLNARVWGNPESPRVLGLHGWLDNAATFDHIAPLLPNIQLVSVDFPGHGFSDFLPTCGNYNNPERAIQMLQVAEALGWTEFSIIGHSLGGIVAQLMAAILPERVKKVVLIDVFGGISQPANTFISQMRKYFLGKERVLPHTIYPNREIAAERRAQSNLTQAISLEAARTLVEGGMREVPGGFSWTFDFRLQFPSLVMLTDEQIDAILENFKTECLLILGSRGMIKEYTRAESLRSFKKILSSSGNFDHIRVHEIEGGHHVHLENPEPVAKLINEFLGVK